MDEKISLHDIYMYQVGKFQYQIICLLLPFRPFIFKKKRLVFELNVKMFISKIAIVTIKNYSLMFKIIGTTVH